MDIPTSTTQQLDRYPAYRESGVAWLGEVPAHWNLLANKYIFKLKKNLVGDRSENYALLSLTLRGVVLRDMDNLQGKFPADFESYQEVETDDFVFCLFDVEETPRCVGLSDHHGMITGAYTVMEAKPDYDRKFLEYFYLNLDRDKRLRPLYTGLRNTISKDNFFSFKTFVPPLPEQTAIARYLDARTAQIDRAVAQKERLIELLRERQQILVQRAVTKGLDPNAPMRDSGVEWLGEVPVGWEVERSQWLFSERKERAQKGDEQLTSSQKYGVIPQVEYMRLEDRRVTQVEFNPEIQKHVEQGDFMISMRSFQGGIEYSAYKGCISSAYVPLIPSPKVFFGYYKYLFKCRRYIEALQSTSNLVRDGQALRFENFRMVPLPSLPIDEQKRIARYLDDRIAKTTQAITLQRTQIERLREYKATLVDAVVTGKVRVQ